MEHRFFIIIMIYYDLNICENHKNYNNLRSNHIDEIKF